MAAEPKPKRQRADWDAIEADYRAGLLSLREMADAHGVSHVMVSKKAKANGWVRDLKSKIQAKADALVNASVVNSRVNSDGLSEREIVEANALRIAQVRGEHRHDITRMRALVLRLLSECEAETAEPGVFAEIGELLRKEDDKGQDRLNDAYHKAISLPQRIKGVKELAETMKVLIGLEREAYGLGSADAPPQDPDALKNLTPNDIARRIAFALSKGLKS